MVSRRVLLIRKCDELNLKIRKQASVSDMENALRDAGVDVDVSITEGNYQSDIETTPRPDSLLDKQTLSQIVDAVVAALPGTASRKRKRAAVPVEEDEQSNFSEEEDDDDLPLSNLGKKSSTPLLTASHPPPTAAASQILSFGAPMALRYSVSEAVERAVLNNKHVAAFKLLRGFDGRKQTHVFSSVDEDGVAKLSVGSHAATERKLDRQPLDISQLIMALLKYKSIVSRVSAERAHNIDCYIANVLSVYMKYPNYAYWTYHSLCWEKIWETAREGVDFNWQCLDPESLHAAIASAGTPNFCTHCSLFDHASAKCPFKHIPDGTASQSRETSATNSSNTGINGSSNSGTYCTYFNVSTCRSRNCTRSHKCLLCKESTHGLAQCPKSD